jgi:hypothetical protein
MQKLCNPHSPSHLQRPALPADVARCDGVGDEVDGWREGCDTCLRRVAPRSAPARMMLPPPVIACECEYLIKARPPGI